MFKFFLNDQFFFLPSITHSFQLLIKLFFFHVIHMHAFYLPTISFYNDKWSTTAQFKIPKTCNNFEVLSHFEKS
jgi:hypothetical protein